MTGHELDQILKVNNVTKSKLASQLNLSQASFEQRLRAKNIKQELIDQIADVVDFDIDKEYSRLLESQKSQDTVPQQNTYHQILPGLYDGSVVDRLLEMLQRRDAEVARLRTELSEVMNMYDKVVQELINLKTQRDCCPKDIV